MTSDPAIAEAQAASVPLRRQLSWIAVLLLTLSSLSPVASIYAVGSGVAQMAGTGTPLLFLVALPAALVWGALYAELGSAYPFAGGDYVGVGRILGPWAGAALITVWFVIQGPIGAYFAISITDYGKELLPWLPPVLTPYLVCAAALAVALMALRASAWITGLFLAIEVCAVLLLIVTPLVAPVHHTGILLAPPMLPVHGKLTVASAGAVFVAFTVAVSATIGGNQAVYFGEEMLEPHARMGHAVMLAAIIGGLATALPVVALLISAPDIGKALASDVPLAAIVRECWGPKVALALDAAVAVAMFNALILQIMGFGRQLFQMGRDRYFFTPVNRFLAHVDPRHGAPRLGVLVAGIITLVSLLLPATLDLIIYGSSTVFILLAVSAAVWHGRRTGKTGAAGFWRSTAFPLVPAAGLLLVVALSVAAWKDPAAGRPGLILLAVVSVIVAIWRQVWANRTGWSTEP